PLLKRMEQHGLVKRERSNEDERVVLLTITELGKQVREDAYDLPQILLNKSQLSEEEWNDLTHLLEKLYQDTKS
ncbi:MarR family winged helix-turn-helix transcriptional regulator, partial [Lactococcus petauri]